MDWEYIFALQTDNLSENEKDELYNTIAWYDLNEDIDKKKLVILLKLSQEVLKYKNDQVEILLHNLDELAMQRGEEEVKKIDSDSEGRSTKSKKSSSIELENLEQKYIELRRNYKKQLTINEKLKSEVENLKKKIKNLEKQNEKLENELEIVGHDESHSEASETKEQYKELVATIQSKNEQISDLLNAIEETERENSFLREKYTNLADQLSENNKQLTLQTNHLNALKTELEESQNEITKLMLQNESLKEELQDILEQKDFFEKQLEDFTQDVNARVDEWKKILDEKDDEIRQLKLQTTETRGSSQSSFEQDNEKMHQIVLRKILMERELQLENLKEQFQTATQEMEENAKIIKELKVEKRENSSKIERLSKTLEEQKRFLRAANERCLTLQENVQYAEKIARNKDEDIKEIINKLKKDGNLEASENLSLIQNLRSDNRIKEKKIMDLVKNSNKLQEKLEIIEKENEVLKEKLGVESDEEIETSAYNTKIKIQKLELKKLKGKAIKFEEERLSLKSEIQKLVRINSILANQLLELGVKPNVEDTSSLQQDNDRKEMKALAEENEALRKGMHEILENINTKREFKEIKCDTLEKLLRALDVRHVSGWYHPAMRLQAEVHNIQGINKELREQLRAAKLELTTIRAQEPKHESKTDESTIVVEHLAELKLSDAKTVMDIENILQKLLTKMDKDQSSIEEYENKVKHHMKHLETIEAQMQLLYREYSAQKECFEQRINEYQSKCNQLKEINEINEKKIIVLSENIPQDSLKVKLINLEKENVILKRKCKYWERQLEKQATELENIKNDLNCAEIICTKKIFELTCENNTLKSKIKLLNNQFESGDRTLNEEFQRNLNNLTVKYRTLLDDFANIQANGNIENKLLKENNKMLLEEKEKFKTLAKDLLEKLENFESMSGDVNVNIESLTKKIANCEINEISERQRADHINNLYELVREQLQKSEEKFKQYENYNKELVQKNLQLQDSLSLIENQFSNFVTVKQYKQLENEHANVLQENKDLQNKLLKLEETLKVMEIRKRENSWNEEKERELLHLKHQIVDLQGLTDEKTLICQLSDDLKQMKNQDNENKRIIENLRQKLEKCKNKCQNLYEDQRKAEEKGINSKEQFIEKMRVMRSIINLYNTQYLGCVPTTCRETFIEQFKNMMQEKHETLINLCNAQKKEKESYVLMEHYKVALKKLEKALKFILQDNNEDLKRIFNYIEENKKLQFNELKYKRQAELNSTQLEYKTNKIKMQNEQIAKLEEELLNLYKNAKFDIIENKTDEKDIENKKDEKDEESVTKTPEKPLILQKSVEVQTIEMALNECGDNEIESLKTQIISGTNEIENKQQTIEQLKSKITELEMSISLFRKQLGDKQSQITFYERHILELQNKKDESKDVAPSNDSLINEEVLTLKCAVKKMQESLKRKDEEILKYQNLLKEDRDKHSLAASLMQDELRTLQKSLNEEKLQNFEFKSSMEPVNKAALEHYFAQVNRLEQELSDYRTKYSNVSSQLQSCRQEAARWSSLANERLTAMENFSKEIEERHQNEISVYKKDSEKWREECGALKQLISKYRFETMPESEYQKNIKEKDNKLHELGLMLRQAKNENKKLQEQFETELSSKFQESLQQKEKLLKENEILKKKFDQLLNKEKSSREEIRELKGQIIRRSCSTLKLSDRSDKSIKDQLQKKITKQEKEIEDLKSMVDKQNSMIESHRARAAEDFEKWNKQKHLYQSVEKLKNKLKAKEQELEKAQQNCITFKGIIERLEREKNNLEVKLKHFKSTTSLSSETNLLKMENNKLKADNEVLLSKLEMQQHHSGGLGAAMLQEKLEAQERKIAVLELSSKASNEVKTEIERLQETISKLQKNNLRLEAENLDLKLDLEKTISEVPHLKEQIHHLENYVEVLKNENKFPEHENAVAVSTNSEKKKASELERTVFVLKRVVEKLQAENKRLLRDKRPCSERTNPSEKKDYHYYRLQEQNFECLEKVKRLELELVTANKLISTLQSKPTGSCNETLLVEFESLKQELERKTELFNKAKILLQRAAVKEKELLKEISELKSQK